MVEQAIFGCLTLQWMYAFLIYQCLEVWLTVQSEIIGDHFGVRTGMSDIYLFDLQMRALTRRDTGGDSQQVVFEPATP